MRRMKDSGVAWIGDIPATWNFCKQKYQIRLINGRAYSDSEFEENGKYRILRVGNLFSNSVWYTSNLELDKDKYCEYGDILYAWSMSYAPVIWKGEKVIYHYHIWKLKINKDVLKKFIFYYLQSLTDALKSEIHETTMGFLTMGIMNNSFIAFPSVEEQQRISDYLDTKCAEIDRSMELVREGIEKLKEYKKSVITEAVTKGLDPDVPMKDSGVPWIGEIPQEWSIQRMKNIATVARGGSPRPIEDYLTDDENGINWIKIGDTIKGHKFIDKVQQKIRIDGLTKTRIVHKGDLILTNSMSFGEPYILNIDGAIHDGWVCLQDIKINIMFLYYLLCSQLCLDQFKLLTSGGVVQNLNIEKIGSVTIFVPSHQEQERIVNYLDAKCAAIDTLITQKQALLDKLAEYKKSLIFECVTGKREVAA